MQHELNPQLPQPPIAAFLSYSQFPTLTHSPSCSSWCVPVRQPNYCIAGSSSTQGTHHSLSRNLSQEQKINNHQNRSGNITRTQLPSRLGSTNTLSPMGPPTVTMICNQPYRMPYQQQSHVQPELNPNQPQPPMAAFSSSQLTHSPSYQSYFSQCATVSPQLQPICCMAGSSSTQGTHPSQSRNRQIPSQKQNDHQNQSGNITTTQLPHMGPIPPTLP